jgi:GNAT superfamily N-acetyltransferase
MQPRTLHVASSPLVIRRARVEEILPLRHRILRAGLPREAADFPGDADANTIHVGAFEVGGAAVGCATMMLNAWEAQPAWQLRGMATDDGWQSLGVGEAVLSYLTALARDAAPAVHLFWCNARVPALRFYGRQGWQVVSEEFEIPTAGPHRKLLRRADGVR